MDSLKIDDSLIVYSFGINQDDSFDIAVAKEFPNSNVYMFDHTNNWPTGDRTNQLHFYSMRVSGEKERNELSKNDEAASKKLKTVPEIMGIINLC